jgi:porin
MGFFRLFVFAAVLNSLVVCADTPPKRVSDPGLGISTNPSTINIVPGTGELGDLIFKAKQEDGVRLGGVWLSDGDVTIAGGTDAGRWSGNNLVVIGLDLDFQKLHFWKGGSFGASFLQFNGMDSNERVGSVQGFDSMSVVAPFTNRSQLYELWIRQTFFDEKLAIRIGKTVPTFDFNNIIRPVPIQNDALAIPGVSGLLYTPIFINPVNIGVMPGYYNSAYGITANIAPIHNFYLSLGAYDGNLARGVQTGLRLGPEFNGYYFYAAEAGGTWLVGKENKPGGISIGGWAQTGKLSIPSVVEENGTQGLYLFGSQRVWFCRPMVDDSGISVFWQLGHNFSKTLPMNDFIGFGFTGFALTRPKDSFGSGLALSWLNDRIFTRKRELMIQAYYQAHLFHTTYLEPVITYIPYPGGGNNLPQTWTATLQMINLF